MLYCIILYFAILFGLDINYTLDSDRVTHNIIIIKLSPEVTSQMQKQDKWINLFTKLTYFILYHIILPVGFPMMRFSTETIKKFTYTIIKVIQNENLLRIKEQT